MQDYKHKNNEMENIKPQFIQCDSIKGSIPKVELTFYETTNKFYQVFNIESEHIDGCNLENAYYANKELQKEYKTCDEYMKKYCPHHNENCYSDCSYAYDKEQYPDFTASTFIKLLEILAVNGYKIEIYDILGSEGKPEFFVNLVKTDDRYHAHSSYLETALIKAITLLKEDKDIMTEIQGIFQKDE